MKTESENTFCKHTDNRLIIDFDEIHRFFSIFSLILKPNQRILLKYQCEKELKLKKNLLLKIIKTMGSKERFKITDNEFIYIENGSAFVFKSKQELSEYKGITHCWIENADGTTQECSDLLRPTALKK
jgi:hypothetical protein